jgi:hypothetical protein
MRGCRTMPAAALGSIGLEPVRPAPGMLKPAAGIPDPSPSSRSGIPGAGQCGLAHAPGPGPLRCPPAQRGDVRPLQALARKVCGRTTGKGGKSMSAAGVRATVMLAVVCAGVALSAVLLTACGVVVTTGSGTAAAQTRHLAAFSSVDLTGSSNVTLHVGGRQSVVVHADGNLLRQVTTQVHARTLIIGTTGTFTTKTR